MTHSEKTERIKVLTEVVRVSKEFNGSATVSILANEKLKELLESEDI